MRTMATAGARYERLLLTDPMFSVILKNRGMQDIPFLEPDLVVVTAGEAAALARRAFVSPPRVLAIGKANENEFFADVLIDDGCADDGFLIAARKAAAVVVPSLAEKTGAARHAALEGLLHRLAVPPSLSGRAYLLCAADMLTASPLLRERLTSAVYPAVAERFHVSRYAVERAMRTAIEYVWLRGSMEEIAALFGMTVDPERGKPTNGEFLALLAQHARNQLSLSLGNSENLSSRSPVSAIISRTSSLSARIPR